MTADLPVDDDRVTDILFACDAALAGGTLPEVTGDLPSAELRPRIERGVAFLVRLQQLRATSPVATAIPAMIDRFVIRKELGRGGFGIVYLAFDPRLGRDVAVKVPHAGAFTAPELRDRFHAEAQTAAGLDHPNLVPVYEAGEVGDLCYLVSAYCPGGTLANWLRAQQTPVPPTDAAVLVETLARAVQHAHDRGVLHRDLKPANILLRKPEHREQKTEDGKPLVCPLSSVLCPLISDFGLAKRLHVPGPETGDGIFAGTPSYMAPEQATTAGVIGPATDVYALGAILYECLTGRPPFQGDGPLDTLAQVRTIDPVSPRRLRPALPRDLETVCLKCLEKEPGRRYGTAGDLADDLGRFRAGRPVAARRVGPGGRTWRWAKRRPVVAGLLAALVAVVLGGSTAIAWQWRRAEANALAMRNQRDAAERERQRAEANFRRAGVAVHAMSLAGDDLFHQKGHEDAGRKIIERAAEFHEGFLADKGDDLSVLQEAARGWAQAAMMRASLGQINAAITANDHAIDLYDRLLVGDPANHVWRLERGKRLRSGAAYHMNWGTDDVAAERDYAAAQAAFESLYADAPDDLSFRFHLANTMMNFGVLLGGKGQADRATILLEAAIELQRRALADVPTDRGWRIELALAQEALGQLLWNRDRSARGEELCQEARESFGRIAAANPSLRDARWFLTRATSSAGERAEQSGRLADAEREYRQALASVNVLRRELPRSVSYAAEQLAVAIKLAAVVNRPAGRTAETEALYRKAIVLAEKLAADFPDESVARRARPATAHLRFAEFLTATGRPDDAATVLRTAARIWPADTEVTAALAHLPSNGASDSAPNSPKR